MKLLELVFWLGLGLSAFCTAQPDTTAQLPLAACDRPQPEQRIALFGNLSAFTHRVSTSSPKAQALFDQGLLLAFNFNQEEARASFEAALTFDPNCAMCHWGLAYAAGPFQNKPAVAPYQPPQPSWPRFTDQDLQTAQHAIARAAQIAGPPRGPTPVAVRLDVPKDAESGLSDSDIQERDRRYIHAMLDRTSIQVPYGPAWAEAEKKYGGDMFSIALQQHDDPVAPALAAEALANLSPWDFWDPVSGAPRATTPAVLLLINTTLERDPQQALALHLMIHVVESLPAGRGLQRAGLAEASADRLLGLYPQLDHLEHMPSHIYLRVGRYADAVQSNVRALRASSEGSHKCLSSAYPDHNTALLVFAASMAADYVNATKYAKVLRELPKFVHDSPASVGILWPVLPLIRLRFADWLAVMAGAAPPAFPASGVIAESRPVNSSSANPGHLRRGTESEALERLPEELAAGLPFLHSPNPLANKKAVYMPDGKEYAQVVYHYTRVLGLAAHVASGRVPHPPLLPHHNVSNARSRLADLSRRLKRMVQEQHVLQLQPDTGVGEHRHTGLPSGTNSSAGGNSSGSSSSGWGGKKGATREDVAAEMELLKAAAAAVVPDVPSHPGQGLGIMSPGYHLLTRVAMQVAEARLALLDGNWTAAAGLLQEAVAVEHSGGYYEPPRQYQPMRQCLGWVWLHQGNVSEAMTAYLDDLAEYPDNPWSMRGLQQVLLALGLHQEVVSLAMSKLRFVGAGASSNMPVPEVHLHQLQQQLNKNLSEEEVARLHRLASVALKHLHQAPAVMWQAMDGLKTSCPQFSERA